MYPINSIFRVGSTPTQVFMKPQEGTFTEGAAKVQTHTRHTSTFAARISQDTNRPDLIVSRC